MENNETMIITPKAITEKQGVKGSYWIVESNKGKMTCFDAESTNKINEAIKHGKACKIYVTYNEKEGKTYTNIKNFIEECNNVVEPKAFVKEAISEARAAKDTSIYTSYAKDLFIAMRQANVDDQVTMANAIRVIKLAKAAFE